MNIINCSSRSRAILLFCAAMTMDAKAAPPEVAIAQGPLFACANDSGMTVSTSNASSSDVFLYQAGYDPATWSGRLRRQQAAADKNGGLQVNAAPDWDAADILTGTGGKAPDPLPASRRIFTASRQPDNTMATVEFKWTALSEEQKTMLNATASQSKPDGLGEKRLDYLRGARELELGKPGGIFRKRDRVLGDIINSVPVYTTAPAGHIPGVDYQAFAEQNKQRKPAVYVGANDGMLHAFDAADGRELFAYVPGFLVPELAGLTHSAYAHRPYVDGAITVAEASVNGKWKTVLAAGMGGGAQGMIALDVTDPGAFEKGAGALFEFTDKDDPDLGNVIGTPVIAKFKIGIEKGKSEYRYFVVVSSGIDNYKDDGAGKFDDAAPGALFLLSLDKSPAAKWEQGVNYYKFKTPLKDNGSPNGLSPPALVTGADGAVLYVYAGDLQGNMWRFNFTGTAPWKNAQPGDIPLFAAKDGEGVRQPITMQPRVAFAPGGGYLVLFGTGKLMEEADISAIHFKTQSFYAIYDTTHSQDSVASRQQLASRVLVAGQDGAFTVNGNEFIYGVGPGGKKGWYLDFAESSNTGERSIATPALAYGRLFFNSVIPDASCQKRTGRSYGLDVLTGLAAEGGATGFSFTGGISGTPLLVETGMTVGGKNGAGQASATKKYVVVNFKAEHLKEDGIAPGGAAPVHSAKLPVRRFSWREVLNWQDLRQAAKK